MDLCWKENQNTRFYWACALVNAAGKSVPCSLASAIPEWFLLPLRGLFRLIDDIKSCGTFITGAVPLWSRAGVVNQTDLRWSGFYILFTSHHFLSRPVFALPSVTHLPLSSSVLLFIFLSLCYCGDLVFHLFFISDFLPLKPETSVYAIRGT